jgi:group I intron endonuclease
MYIYKTTNTTNNKIYIGISCKNSCKNTNYIGSGKALKRAVKKYGKENFTKEIIVESVFFKYYDLQALEIYFIALFNSTNKDIGYNISQGGDGNFGEANGMFGKNHSKESIKSMVEKRKSRSLEDPTYGKMSEYSLKKFSKFVAERNRTSPTLPNGHTEDSKKKISETTTRMLASGEITRNYATFSEERKQEWSERFSGEGNPFYGKTHSEDTKEKIRQSMRNNQPPANKLDDEGNILKHYESLTDVYEDGYRPDLVKLVSKGQNNRHKGFKWEVLEK